MIDINRGRKDPQTKGDGLQYEIPPIDGGNQCFPSSLDKQVGGSYYKDFRMQPVEFAFVNGLNFLQGNIIKYVCRYKGKNGRQDLEKARHYIDLLIELEYGSIHVEENEKGVSWKEIENDTPVDLKR